jgi:hypothetical protein
LNRSGVFIAIKFLDVRLGSEKRFYGFLLFFSQLVGRDWWHAILSDPWNSEPNEKQQQAERKPMP